MKKQLLEIFGKELDKPMRKRNKNFVSFSPIIHYRNMGTTRAKTILFDINHELNTTDNDNLYVTIEQAISKEVEFGQEPELLNEFYVIFSNSLTSHILKESITEEEYLSLGKKFDDTYKRIEEFKEKENNSKKEIALKSFVANFDNLNKHNNYN
jgi:hypothetical protein